MPGNPGSGGQGGGGIPGRVGPPGCTGGEQRRNGRRRRGGSAGGGWADAAKEGRRGQTACLGPAPRTGRRCLEGRSLAGACARLSLQSRTVLRPRFPALSDHPVLPVPGFPVRPVAARTSPFTSMDRELLSRSVGSGLCTRRVVGTLTNEWTAMSPGFGVTQACQPWPWGFLMTSWGCSRHTGALVPKHWAHFLALEPWQLPHGWACIVSCTGPPEG